MSSPSMDGESGFYEALNFIEDPLRLDLTLSGTLPKLDDMDALQELAGLSYNVPDEIVQKILATSFFFELDQLPTKQNGRFYCQGSILCTWRRSNALVKRVINEFAGAQFQTGRGDYLGEVGSSDVCHKCEYYRKKVDFMVASLEEAFSIMVAGSSCRQKIGGFPKSVQELLVNQQASAHFGRADHLVCLWPSKRNCYCLRRTKRRVQFVEPPLHRKKRRL